MNPCKSSASHHISVVSKNVILCSIEPIHFHKMEDADSDGFKMKEAELTIFFFSHQMGK
jgi:hypothetical protein